MFDGRFNLLQDNWFGGWVKANEDQCQDEIWYVYVVESTEGVCSETHRSRGVLLRLKRKNIPRVHRNESSQSQQDGFPLFLCWFRFRRVRSRRPANPLQHDWFSIQYGKRTNDDIEEDCITGGRRSEQVETLTDEVECLGAER